MRKLLEIEWALLCFKIFSYTLITIIYMPAYILSDYNRKWLCEHKHFIQYFLIGNTLFRELIKNRSDLIQRRNGNLIFSTKTCFKRPPRRLLLLRIRYEVRAKTTCKPISFVFQPKSIDPDFNLTQYISITTDFQHNTTLCSLYFEHIH